MYRYFYITHRACTYLHTHTPYDALILQWHRNRKVEKIFPWKIGLNVLDVVRGQRIININVCVSLTLLLKIIATTTTAGSSSNHKKLWIDAQQCMWYGCRCCCCFYWHLFIVATNVHEWGYVLLCSVHVFALKASAVEAEAAAAHTLFCVCQAATYAHVATSYPSIIRKRYANKVALIFIIRMKNLGERNEYFLRNWQIQTLQFVC